MLSRVIYGARVSLMIAVIGTLAGAVIGVLAGLVSGYRRGAIDDVVMLVVDAYMALPFIVIALAVIAMLGTSLVVITILAAISGFAGYTRIARGLALQVGQEQYVLAARSIGLTFPRILLRHALPNMAAPLIVLATMEMSSIILLEASLSFLGFGIQPPTPSWGLMVSEGRDYLASSWWVGVPPGVAIMVIAMCISLLGDWLRDVLDPTTRD
jgi:peptide/nickel transport system permease protein